MSILTATMLKLPPPRRAAARSAHAFTLIEVLIATFIFALGLLGLLALFAGAAIQQQEASRITNSVLAGNAAEAVVGRNAGRIEYRDNANLPNPTEMNNLLPEDQWRVLKHNVPGGQSGTQSGFLWLRPDGTPPRANFFFVVPALEPLPLDLYVRPPSQPQNGQGLYTFSGNQLPFRDSLREFGASRIHRESLGRIEVVTEESNATQVTNIRRIIFTPRTDLPTGFSTAQARTMLAFSPTSSPGSLVDPNDYIVVNLDEFDNNASRGRIESMRIADVVDSGATRRVSSIRVPFYEWRNDRLISLSDRVSTRADETRDDGRRPVLSYSLMYRRTSSGASQLAVFTYSLRAPSPGSQFVPVESEAANDPKSPLQKVAVRLAYDDARRQYYITLAAGGGLPSIAGADRFFVMRTGAILLVEGEDDGDPAGSDLPVRVVETTLKPDGTPDRAYLERAPRSKGASYIGTLPGGTAVLNVWTVKPTVTSDDGSVWRIEPVDARVLQTG